MIRSFPSTHVTGTDASVDLVLALVGGRVGGRDRPEGPAAGGGAGAVDWDRFTALLERHGLQGLAVASHRTNPFLPDGVARALEEPYLHTALHTTLTVDAGSRARSVLGEAGIPALLYKGVALVEAGVYRDPGARAVGDADLLVPPDRAGAAVAVLREAGFEPWSEWEPTSVEWLDSASFTDLRAPRGTEISLDLHWRLGYGRLRYGSSSEEIFLWEDVDAEEGRPADPVHLVILLEHLLKHFHVTSHLRGVADVVRLSDRVRDWEPVWRRIRSRSSGRGLALVLDVLRVRLGAPVPGEVERLAESGAWRDAGRKALDPRRMVTGYRESEGRMWGLLRRWAVLGSSRLVLAEALHTTLPGRRWLRARYGEPRGYGLPLLFRYWKDVARWAGGRGSSPVSPNQEPW